ncbi:uncharacterized protein LOC108830844 isoform X1 [Raphanus sativus]|uniref:Uncharacterized protein LOC108830844 isoform X1 n=1 Tax=Raphanus sativus TaxID=3726 RepID=A0A9W3CP11_RAPSA|nr:uncharacterized protein LOC108830844 isoform X1 [Raphanus sativus]
MLRLTLRLTPNLASDAEKSRVRDVNDAARLPHLLLQLTQRIFSSLPFTDHKLSLPFTDYHHELSSPIDAGHRPRVLSLLRLTKTSTKPISSFLFSSTDDASRAPSSPPQTHLELSPSPTHLKLALHLSQALDPLSISSSPSLSSSPSRF